MMQSATSLTSSGLRDWLVQRVTAVVVGCYVIFLLLYFLCHPHLTFNDWHGLLMHPLMRIFSFLTLFSVVAHAWIGMWTVFTDYVKATPLRLLLQVLMALALLSYLIWGALIFSLV